MAITSLLAAAYTGTNLTSQASGSITPTANALLIVDIAFTGGSVGVSSNPTLSGNGITWGSPTISQASSSGAPGEKAFRWMVLAGASPSAGAITVTAAGSDNFTTMNIAVTQVTDVSQSTPVVAANTVAGTDEAAIADVNYAQSLTSGNYFVSACIAWEADSTWTARSGWSELSDVSDATAPGPSLTIQYRTSDDTAAGGTCSATTYLATIASEVAIVTAPIEQEGFRFYDDDAGANSATALASQDTNINRSLATNTRLRVLLNATGDPASFSPQLEYKLNSGSYQKVEVADGAALAYGAMGTATTTGTTAPTVAYPAGITAGQLLVMVVGNRPNASTVTKPTGWEDFSGSNTATGGAGSEGAGTGTMRVTMFYRIADGTETGSVTLSIGSGTSVSACIFRVTRGLAKQFSLALATGADSSAGTAWSVTFGSDPGVTANDLVYVFSVSSEDTASFASEALSQTGITYGTMVERLDQNVTTGNDQRLVVAEFPVTSGTSSAAATYTMTASGTNSANAAGVSMMLRIRQIDQVCVMSASSNITASGDNSTAQLTAPSGKSTSDFVTGRVVDDENPADAVDITTDDYTEYEWCIKALSPAVGSDVISFRVTKSGSVLDTYTVTPTLTIGSAAYTLTASSGSLTLTGRATGLTAQRKITAAQGTYALSGQATLFHRGFYLFAVAGSYTLTGNAQGLKQGRRLTAAQGAYSLTGQAVTLTAGAGRVLTANAGTYALTGQAAALNRGRRMTAAAATYALTGNATGVRWAHLLTATSATYTYTGNAVTLHAASPPGSYLLTGNAVGLRWAHRLTAASGSYALTGQATGFKRALRMVAATTTYALNGQAVALTKQSTGAFSLGASPGTFTITGGTTNLKWGHKLVAAPASYSYTGVSVGLLHFAPGGFTITAEGVTYALTGRAAGLLRGAAVGATAGTYALTGSAIAFHTTFHLPADHGVYLLTGQDVSMVGPPPVVTFYPGKYRAEWASALADVRAAGI